MILLLGAGQFMSCFYHTKHGFLFWTAGQRVKPTDNSPFIWRAKSPEANAETLSLMDYTNWAAKQPDYHLEDQSCMIVWSGYSYTWDDNKCTVPYCSICEIDI